MAIYDKYASRERVNAGIYIKQRQARKIFDFGLHATRNVSGGILEIGPGDGYIAESARAANLGYLSVEGSTAVAEKLRDRGFNVAGGYVPPLPDEVGTAYRCCFMLHVLEHMKDGVAAAQIVSEVRNALVPGGAIVVACPDYARWGHYFYDCDYTHSYPLTRRRLAQLLEDHGFEVVKYTVYVGPIFGFAGLPISWCARALYWPLMDDLMASQPSRNLLNRGFLTFLPNILMVARRS